MSMWMDKKVLVTGGGGFLGRTIVKQLREAGCGHVRILGRSSRRELVETGVEVVQGDLRDPKTVKQACVNRDAVFHCAAKAGVWGARDEFYEINVTGTRNVIQACRENSVPILVHTSSPSVAYPPTLHVENWNEKHVLPERYLAAYPETKAIAEQEALAADSHMLKVAAIRPHLIWGAGDPHLLPRLVKRAKSGRLAIVGDGCSKVDLTHVENAAAAHIQVAEGLINGADCHGKTYFVSDDAPVNLWEWINDLLARLDIPPIKKRISYRTAYNIGAVLEFIFRALGLSSEPPMTRFVAGQLAFSHYFDISAAKKDFGYHPVVDPEIATRDTIEWLKASCY